MITSLVNGSLVWNSDLSDARDLVYCFFVVAENLSSRIITHLLPLLQCLIIGSSQRPWGS